MQDSETQLIESEIEKYDEYDDFFDENKKLLKEVHPGTYIEKLLCEKKLKKAQVVSKLNINKGYAYEILRQEKHPDRDKVLQFAIAMELSILETQNMLNRCGYACLYGKNLRDTVIYFCIIKQKSIIDTNLLLYNHGFELL